MQLPIHAGPPRPHHRNSGSSTSSGVSDAPSSLTSVSSPAMLVDAHPERLRLPPPFRSALPERQGPSNSRSPEPGWLFPSFASFNGRAPGYGPSPIVPGMNPGESLNPFPPSDFGRLRPTTAPSSGPNLQRKLPPLFFPSNSSAPANGGRDHRRDDAFLPPPPCHSWDPRRSWEQGHAGPGPQSGSHPDHDHADPYERSVPGWDYRHDSAYAESRYGGDEQPAASPVDGPGAAVASPGGKKRRGNLPKATTMQLKGWFAEHVAHPYPTEEEKQWFMARTGLTMSQVSRFHSDRP